MLSAALVLSFMLINLTGIWMTGPFAWDDGAITLAFARTLAESGTFALTKCSEVVEGSSSLLFVGVMALSHRLLNFDFFQFILASQLLTLIFVVLTAFVLYNALAEPLPKTSHRLVVVGLTATLPMFTAEVLNGMEMSVFSFLLLCYHQAFKRSSVWVHVLTPLILLVRFEAIFYLALPLAMVFLLGRKRSVWWPGIYTFLVFLLIGLGRWLYFGDVMPNTVWAKMNPPYSDPSFSGKLLGLREFWSVTAPILAPAVLVTVWRGDRARLLDPVVWTVLSFAIFAGISGRNWGYDGRMSLASVPLMVQLLASGFTGGGRCGDRRARAWPSFLRQFNGSALTMAVCTLSLVAAHWANRPLHVANAKLMLAGARFQALLPPALDALVAPCRNRKLASEWYGVTPANYRLTGLAVDRLRVLLGREVIKLMVPDVGGLALSCPNIQVIDLALLTNVQLARSGYRTFGPYLAEVAPDVVETHGVWSELTGIHNIAFFRDNYSPVVLDANLLWLRNDHLARLSRVPSVRLVKVDKVAGLRGVRYANQAVDMVHLHQRQQDWIYRVAPPAQPAGRHPSPVEHAGTVPPRPSPTG